MKMPIPLEITSRDNPSFKKWESLLTSRGIKDEKLFFIFGEKVILETLRFHSDLCVQLIMPSGIERDFFSEREWLQAFSASPAGFLETLKIAKLPPTLFKELDLFGTRQPLLICKTTEIASWSETETCEGLELVAPLSEPSNLGALIRSSVAFGVDRLILTKESASPFHPKCSRAASGSILKIKFAQGPSVEELEGPLLALDSAGESLSSWRWSKNSRILVGPEGKGLPQKFRTPSCLKIPISSNAESLNATIAASVALFSYRLKYPIS